MQHFKSNKKDGYRQWNVRQFLHILASPGTIAFAVNVTWMERGFNACQTHCSMFPCIYRQPFPSNSTRKFKSSPFWHIFAHMASPGYAPGTITIMLYMDGKRIQCWSNALQHIPICLQPFTSYRSEIATFSCSLAFNAPVGGVPISHWNNEEKFGPQQTRIMGLSGSEDSLTIG